MLTHHTQTLKYQRQKKHSFLHCNAFLPQSISRLWPETIKANWRANKQIRTFNIPNMMLPCLCFSALLHLKYSMLLGLAV